MNIYMLIALLVVYQLKHLLADFVLQGRYMLGKFQPGWHFVLPLLAHVAVHGGFTFIICMGAGASLLKVVSLCLFDMTVHFIMDRIKASPRWMGRWKSLASNDYKMALYSERCGDSFVRGEAKQALRGNKLFWWALGFDQMVHHLTHYVIILALVIR